MRLLVTHSDLNEQDCIVADLVEDLRAMDAIDLCIETELKTGSEGTENRNSIRKGDPVTIAAIVIAAVGAGGALTAAASKGGLFTRIAEIIGEYVNRKVQVSIASRDGDSVQLKGSVADIEHLLRDHAE